MINQADEYERNFSIGDAYTFLAEHKLENMAEEIRNSKDRFMSYGTTLKRAKVIKALTDNNLLDEFVNKIWPSGKTNKGKTRIQFWQGLYDRFINGGEDTGADDDETESGDEKQFAYEKDLQNYLANNLNKIETGLKLYSSPEGVSGFEYQVDNDSRRIDILAIDRTGTPVIIELKVNRGHERVIGQVSYYLAMIKRKFNTNKVRIIIIAREISDQLRLAAENIPDTQLYEYELSMDLQPITYDNK